MVPPDPGPQLPAVRPDWGGPRPGVRPRLAGAEEDGFLQREEGRADCGEAGPAPGPDQAERAAPVPGDHAADRAGVPGPPPGSQTTEDHCAGQTSALTGG